MQYIDLTSPKGNAFGLMAEAKNLGKQLGYSKEEVNEVLNDMQSGDYDNLCDVFAQNFGHVVELVNGHEDEDEESNYNDEDYEGDNWDMDGDALASAGFGTDEDYGYYGEDY
jgi:hypothetical protein